MGSRGARASLFGSNEPHEIKQFDPEMAEKENDKGIDDLAGRISLLKGLSMDIKSEVDTHNSILDRMGLDMGGAKALITGTMERFKKVFEDKSSRKMAMIVGGMVGGALIIYKIAGN